MSTVFLHPDIKRKFAGFELRGSNQNSIHIRIHVNRIDIFYFFINQTVRYKNDRIKNDTYKN